MTDRERDAVILIYTNACVELHHKFVAKQDHSIEMLLCDALEVRYPDVISELRNYDKKDSEAS